VLGVSILPRSTISLLNFGTVCSDNVAFLVVHLCRQIRRCISYNVYRGEQYWNTWGCVRTFI